MIAFVALLSFLNPLWTPKNYPWLGWVATALAIWVWIAVATTTEHMDTEKRVGDRKGLSLLDLLGIVVAITLLRDWWRRK
jgi:hypothetical protein